MSETTHVEEVLPGLPELPDDSSWAEPIDPVARKWKIIVGILGAALVASSAFALGVRFAPDDPQASAAAGFGAGGRGAGGGRGLGGQTGQGGQGGQGVGGAQGSEAVPDAGTGGLFPGLPVNTANGATEATSSGTPTVSAVTATFGTITAVTPDVVTIDDIDGTAFEFTLTDETLISRTRLVPAAELTVGQSITVTPTTEGGTTAASVSIDLPA